MIKNKKWYSEKEICDLIQSDYDSLCDALDNYSPYIFREFSLAHKLRADFLIYSEIEQKHVYDIIEVKLNADLDSVYQICNYVWVSESHVRNAPTNSLKENNYKFNGHLISKTFDKGVYSVASMAGIKLWRYSVNDNDPENPRISLEEESHPFEEVSLSQNFLNTLKYGNPIESELMSRENK